MNNGVFQTPKSISPIPFSPFLHPSKTLNSFFSIPLPKHKFLKFHIKSPSINPIFASKTPNKLEIEDEFEGEIDLEDEFEEDEDEGEEEEDILVPLRNMREWTRNKPLGFGEGKVYDTSIEDKLMEELEQSRVAQIANVTNLKNNPEDGNPNSKKEKIPKKVPEVAPNGIRVRLVHLPKKKNIHRDLQAAFKPFSGITNIIPAVSGNEKTREPVCKGFAFVDFKSEKDANRFVDIFSTQPMTFGKVQKQIKCEIMKSTSPNPSSVEPIVHKPKNTLPITNPDAKTSFDSLVNDAFSDKINNGDKEDLVSVVTTIDNFVQEKQEPENSLPISNPVSMKSNLVTETSFDSHVNDAGLDKMDNGDEEEDLVSVVTMENFDDLVQEKQKSEMGSEGLMKQTKDKGSEKKKTKKIAKKKVENTTPKLKIPGSAKKLKSKEKALLSGVFEKYGGKAAMGTKVLND